MRGRLIKALATVAMIGMWTGQAGAEPSLNEVLKEYDNPNTSETRRATISSNLAGIGVGLGWASTAVRAQRMQAGLYCPPDQPEMPSAQLIEILRRALKDEPRLGDRPLGFALLAALQRSFPCK
jgi:hypothetical protein